MEISELVAAVKEADPKAFADALNKEATDHYQVIFKRGHSKAQTAADTDLNAVKGDLAKRDSEIADLQAKVATLEEGNPDKATLEKKYRDTIEEKDKAIAKLQGEAKTKDSEHVSKIQNLEQRYLTRGVENYLISNNVDKDFAKMKAKMIDFEGRVKFNDDGTIKQVMMGDTITPIDVPEGSDIETVLAKEIYETTDGKWIDDKRQSASRLGDLSTNGRTAKFTRSQIRDMDEKEYSENRDAIRAALDAGEVVDDIG